MKKIVVACDSYKGCLSSLAAGGQIKEGVLRVFPQCEVSVLPIADGGEGTISCFAEVPGAQIILSEVCGPDGRRIHARYVLLHDTKTAVIEMAEASGLTLVKGRNDPRIATTFGTGELILSAAKNGAKHIILCIGGSATIDGGLGAARALGMRFLAEDKREIKDAGELVKLEDIDISGLESLLKGISVTVSCDVKNVLCGIDGAAYVYGAQKGAGAAEMKLLDGGLKRLSEIIRDITGKDLANIEGSGAAGGISLPFLAFLDAELKSGIELILKAVDFEDKISGAQLIITGEGKTDAQSVNGKVVSGIGLAAKKHGIPVIAISGALGEGYKELHQYGVCALFSVQDGPMSLGQSIAGCKTLLSARTEQIMRLLSINVKP